jgi:glycoprotein 6-alpha-L-fucosyltransferase
VRLERFHGDPFVWWAGQLLSYLTRPNDEFRKVIVQKTTELKFRSRCVGVHVRRTDKVGTEAAFHSLKEYMDEVELFYKMQTINNAGSVQKCVYLATDEIAVLKEAKEQ